MEGMTENGKEVIWERTGVEGMGYDDLRNCAGYEACIVFVLLIL